MDNPQNLFYFVKIKKKYKNKNKNYNIKPISRVNEQHYLFFRFHLFNNKDTFYIPMLQNSIVLYII